MPHSPQQPLSTFPLLPSSTICSFCRHGLDGPPRVHLDLRHTPFQSAIQCSSTHHPEPPVRGIQCYPVCNGVQINRHCVMMPTGEHLPQNLKVDRYDIRLHYSDFFFFLLQSFVTPPLWPSLVHYPHCPPLPFYYFFLLYSILSLLSSPLCSFSPDVGAGPGGSCCSLQFVSVKHQLVSEGVCTRLLGRSCSSTPQRLWTFIAFS